MRVDDFIIFVTRVRNADEARKSALAFAENWPLPLAISRIEADGHVDGFGKRAHRITLVPDWRGYDGS